MARTSIFSRETPTFAPFVVPMGLWPRLPTFARASFPAEGGAFSVVSVHLDRPTEPGQVSQIAAFNELLAHYTPDRLIVAGDFNLTPWSFALRRLDAQFGLERRDRALFSWPARLSPGRGRPRRSPSCPSITSTPERPGAP